LFHLKEEGVRACSALEEHQVHPHADAADTHNLPDGVDLGEAVEEVAPVLLEGQAVLGEEVVDELILLVVVDRHADRGSSVMRGLPWPWP